MLSADGRQDDPVQPPLHALAGQDRRQSRRAIETANVPKDSRGEGDLPPAQPPVVHERVGIGIVGGSVNKSDDGWQVL
jgi:hypothetical protein